MPLKSTTARSTTALNRILRAKGAPITHTVRTPVTNETFVSTGGNPYDRTCAWAHTDASGLPIRDPGSLDPVASAAVLRDSTRKAAHSAAVQEMLLQLVEHYRPDLMRHPHIRQAAEIVTATIEPNRERFTRYRSIYLRWDAIVTSFIWSMDELPAGPCK
ncbi:hypothetical protein [Methylobacterium sp. CM6257]